MKGYCEYKGTWHWCGVGCRSVYLLHYCWTRHRQYKARI